MTGIVQATQRWDALGGLRRIDAFAMALWPSLGYQRVAYEIKVSRADWLKELDAPTKMAQGYFLSDQFVFALAEGVYHADDFRRTHQLFHCGIYEVSSDGKIKKHRRPRRSEAAWPMPETFIASLLRRVSQMALKKATDALAEIETVRYAAQMPPQYEHGLGSWIRELANLATKETVNANTD